MVEHLSSQSLVELIELSARKISPGGALVVETIDPRSLYATANYFWADLSHVRPVHPSTLLFLVEQAGFSQVGTVQRNRHDLADIDETDAADPLHDAVNNLLDTVYGHQDYAVIAYR